MSAEGGGDVLGAGLHRRRTTVIAIAAAVIVLVAMVSAGGQVPLATQGAGGFNLGEPVTPEQPNERPPPDRRTTEQTADAPGMGALGVLAQAILIVVAGALLYLSGRAAMRTWRRTKYEQPEPPDELQRMVPPLELVDAIDEGLAAMAAGPIDDVVIECWVRLEDAAAAAGVERLTSETASELASRVLDDLHAPPSAVEDLLARYRTARYSQHHLGEDDRAVAIRSLEEIRAAIVGTPA
jgi:Domain of unknown function (DUF4129)